MWTEAVKPVVGVLHVFYYVVVLFRLGVDVWVMIAPKEVKCNILFYNIDWLLAFGVHASLSLDRCLEEEKFLLTCYAFVLLFHFTHVVLQLFHHRGAKLLVAGGVFLDWLNSLAKAVLNQGVVKRKANIGVFVLLDAALRWPELNLDGRLLVPLDLGYLITVEDRFQFALLACESEDPVFL